jgi:hypothetical protein
MRKAISARMEAAGLQALWVSRVRPRQPQIDLGASPSPFSVWRLSFRANGRLGEQLLCTVDRGRHRRRPVDAHVPFLSP